MSVSDQIIQVLNALCEKFGIVIDWTSANVIPYLETLCGKLVIYEIWTSVAWMGIMVALAIASVVAIKRFAPMFREGLKEDQYSGDVGWEMASIFSIIGLAALYLATIIVMSVQIMDIIKCTTFPELFIFEYVQRLINSGS